MISSTHVMRTVRLLAALGALTTVLAQSALPAAHADEGAQTCTASVAAAGDSVSSPAGDCPSVTVETAADGRVIVQYWGSAGAHFYQLRWSSPGTVEKQVAVRGRGPKGGSWALANPGSGTEFTFKVRSCINRATGLECTGWQETTYQAPTYTIRST
jgi:hypothetical protein